MRRLAALPLLLGFLLPSSFLLLPSASASDVSVTAASVIPSSAAIVRRYTAGATLTAGKVVYLDPADNKVKAADANGASPLYKAIGITVNGASNGQPIRVCIEDPSFTPGFTTASGTTYILSATAGGIAPNADAATGWFKTTLGTGLSATKMKLKLVRSDTAVP